MTLMLSFMGLGHLGKLGKLGKLATSAHKKIIFEKPQMYVIDIGI